MERLLETTDLCVRRGRRTLLTDVSLVVGVGEAIHLAGANGSGKTSLLRVLAGLAVPAGGRLERRGACAFVPEKPVLAGAARCVEWLVAMQGLRGVAAADWPTAARVGGLTRRFSTDPSRRVSKGMLQRIVLLEALHSRRDRGPARNAQRAGRSGQGADPCARASEDDVGDVIARLRVNYDRLAGRRPCRLRACDQ